MRYNWIDSLKGFAVILVIIGHLPFDDKIDTYIYSFHMPLFFFISGYLFNREKYSIAEKFIVSRVKSILLPYFLLSICSYIIFVMTNEFNLPYEGDISQTIYSTLYASYNYENFDLVILNAALWFLPCLFVTSMLFYILFKLFNRSSKLFTMSMIIVSLIGYYSIDYLPQAMPWSIDIALTAVTFYSAGYLFRNNFEDKFFKVSEIFIIFLMVISLLSINMDGTDLTAWEFNENYFTFYLFAFSGILGYMYIFKKIGYSRILEYYGRNSLIIFGLHIPILWIIEKIIDLSSTFLGQDIPQDDLLWSIIKLFIILVLVLPIIYVTNRIIKNNKIMINENRLPG